MDAQTLARLARIDPQLLCPVQHRSAQAQADLMMIRPEPAVRARTGLVNAARGLAKSYENDCAAALTVGRLPVLLHWSVVERREATALRDLVFGRNLPLCFWLPVEFFLGQYGSLSKFLFGPRCCPKHRSASRYHWCERH